MDGGDLSMKKIIYFIPAILALLLYAILALADSSHAINPWAKFWVAILFIASGLMCKNKWYGCIAGLIVGCVLVYMGTQSTGQVLDLERPLGIILCSYYLICGAVVYKKAKG